jgi:hypothetical protein
VNPLTAIAKEAHDAFMRMQTDFPLTFPSSASGDRGAASAGEDRGVKRPFNVEDCVNEEEGPSLPEPPANPLEEENWNTWSGDDEAVEPTARSACVC